MVRAVISQNSGEERKFQVRQIKLIWNVLFSVANSSSVAQYTKVYNTQHCCTEYNPQHCRTLAFFVFSKKSFMDDILKHIRQTNSQNSL